MKFGLEDACSEVLEGLGRMSFHATFHTAGKTMGVGINEQALLNMQPGRVCAACAHRGAAAGSSTPLRWGTARGFPREAHALTLPFLCPHLRAGSAAIPRLCLTCEEDRQVSSWDGEDVFSKDRKVWTR